MAKTRIRRATSARHSRNIRRAEIYAFTAACNPANIELFNYVIEQVIY